MAPLRIFPILVLLLGFPSIAWADLTIENQGHSTLGRIRSDGTVESTSHSTLGYIRPDGTIENVGHSTRGYVKDTVLEMDRVIVAYLFFFHRGLLWANESSTHRNRALPQDQIRYPMETTATKIGSAIPLPPSVGPKNQ